jgi:hypothetical protein
LRISIIFFTGNLNNASSEQINRALFKSYNNGKDFEKLISLEYPVTANDTYMWIVIQNINNTSLQTVMKKQKVEKGLFKKQFGVSSIDLGKGDFFVRIYTSYKPMQEKKFTLNG